MGKLSVTLRSPDSINRFGTNIYPAKISMSEAQEAYCGPQRISLKVRDRE